MPVPSLPRSIPRGVGVLRLLVLTFVLAMMGAVLPAPSVSADVGLTRYSWSANIGRIAAIGPWVRKLDFTLSPSSATSGRVSVAIVQFDPTVTGARTVIGYAGPCNRVERCPIYTPTPSVKRTWVGSYRFGGTDNVGTLSITWDNGNAESWSLSQARNGTLGSMSLRSAAYQGSDPTHGSGYGSKQPHSLYKSMGQVDSITDSYTGRIDVVVNAGAPTIGSAWNLNVGGMNGSVSYPKGLYMLQSPFVRYDACPAHLRDITGTVYTMWVNNANRTMTQNNWRRCLVQASTGAYHGDLHMTLLSQVIDDHKNMVGVVGVESSASGGSTLALVRAIKA